MRDRRKQALRVQFDGKLRLEFHGAEITSDAGLPAFRELDEAFRLTEKGSTLLADSRRGKNTQHSVLAMLRRAIYGRLAGHDDVNDADRLRMDAAMRHVVGGRAKEREAASTSEMSRFETEMLSSRENLTALMNLSGAWIGSVQECAPLDKPILDMGSSENKTYGEQEGSAYSGYFECTCYHPLFLFNQHGDLERAMLRRGNHHSAKDNQTRLQLFALAYNLGNFLWRLVLPRSVKHWSLTTLREKLIKIGAKVVRHAKCVAFQLAEVAMPRELFAAILDRIQRFGVPAPLVEPG